MILWGIFWGAVIGSFLSGWGGWLGGFFGFFAGWTLRMALRHEIAKSQSKAPPALAETRPASPPQAVRDGWEDQGGWDAPGTAEAFSAAANEAAHIPRPAAQPALSPSPSQPVMAPAPVLAANGLPSARAMPPWVDTMPPGNAYEPARTAPRLNPQPAAKRYEPDPVERAFTAARDWLLGGNTIVRVGLVILFIGLSFLVRYAAVAGLFPVELRLAVVGAAALALLAVGFGKRQTRPDFALALQGGGVAVLYLTVFAAFRLYALMPVGLAFGLMIVVCALSCALALLQNSSALAVAAFAGGFAVPLLLSTGRGSHVALFSYYAVLNLAILFIAWKRTWRILNAVGFIATFGVATTWGILKYQPEHYASAQFFLLLFVLIYLLTAVLYARNTPTRLGSAVDSMLVFGTPLIGFGLQAGLVRQDEFGSAFSALGFSALYLTTALLLARRKASGERLLIECLTAIGVGFATLAVPLALDARWTSAVWALEGAGAFWAGLRQARWMPRAFGLLMQLVAGLVFLQTVGESQANVAAWPLANPLFIGALFIALPALGIAWWLRQPLPHSGSRWALAYAAFERQLASPAYLYGFAFWCLAWVLEAARHLPAAELGQMAVPVFSQGTAQLLALLALVASAALSHRLGRRTDWPVATLPSRLTLLTMALMLLVQLANEHRVLQWPGWALWLATLALHYRMLWHNDALAAGAGAGAAPARTGPASSSPSFAKTHIGSVWFLTALLADALWFGIERGHLQHSAWAGAVLLVSATAVLMLLALWAGRANQAARLASFGWPLNPHAAAYYAVAAQPLAALVFVGALLVALYSSGRTEPLPYVPLLNPTDLSVALGLGALAFWRQILLAARPAGGSAALARAPQALVALAGLSFVALNTVWLRIAHHFLHIDWDAGALFSSFVVQTGYAILWTLLALTLMVLANRRVQRPLWLTGAGLLGLVVLKLLVVDLSNAGGAERIIAFIAVGVLMLVVGYLAPLPPRAQTSAAETEKSLP
jgi:uncharacterized membrane protein